MDRDKIHFKLRNWENFQSIFKTLLKILKYVRFPHLQLFYKVTFPQVFM